LTAGNLEKLFKRKTSDGECYVDTVRLGHPDLYFLPNGPTRKIKPGSIKHIIQVREKYRFSLDHVLYII
jgi:hypothetical protein